MLLCFLLHEDSILCIIFSPSSPSSLKKNLGIPQPIYKSTKGLWPHYKSDAWCITPERVSNPEPELDALALLNSAELQANLNIALSDHDSWMLVMVEFCNMRQRPSFWRVAQNFNLHLNSHVWVTVTYTGSAVYNHFMQLYTKFMNFEGSVQDRNML